MYVVLYDKFNKLSTLTNAHVEFIVILVRRSIGVHVGLLSKISDFEPGAHRQVDDGF